MGSGPDSDSKKDLNSSLQKQGLTHPSDGFESGLGMAQKTQTWAVLQDSDSNPQNSDNTHY